jgi:hypothetical protein
MLLFCDSLGEGLRAIFINLFRIRISSRHPRPHRRQPYLQLRMDGWIPSLPIYYECPSNRGARSMKWHGTLLSAQACSIKGFQKVTPGATSNLFARIYVVDNMLNSAITLYPGQELFECFNICLGLGLGTAGKNHIDSSAVHD